MTPVSGPVLLALVMLLDPIHGYYTLTPLSSIRLPYSVSRGEQFKLFGDTAVAAAYDPIFSRLYVVGANPHLLHVVDVTHPTNPVREFSYTFTVGEGIPRDVAVCDKEIAVAVESPEDSVEGHIYFFKTYDGIGGTLTTDGFITVGNHPSRLKYSPSCDILVVANKGSAGKDLQDKYSDPEGRVYIIRSEKTGNPSVRYVDFNFYNNRTDIRAPGKYVPNNILPSPPTIAQDLQPVGVDVTSDGKYAYVTMQDNDAIAKIDIIAGTVLSLNPVGKKDWSSLKLDASDRDGGVHRRNYKFLKSLRQPGEIRTAKIGRNDFLFTADEGSVRSYTSTLHTFTWSDVTTAKSIATSIDTIATSDEFKANASNDEYLGRLQVSRFDGYDTAFNKNQYTELYAFGGRGFSVWNSNNLNSPVFDSGDTIEDYTEAYDKNVFNTNCLTTTTTYQSPETLRDSTSNFLGPQINTLDIMTDNGTTFLVVGSKTSGTLFLYTVDMSGSAPVLSFQTVVRSGLKDFPWADLYNMNESGDLYISRIGFIPADESPNDQSMLFVVSNGSGSVSLYQLEFVSASITGSPIVG